MQEAITEHRSKHWKSIQDMFSRYAVSSRPAWKKLSTLRGNLSSRQIPCLYKKEKDGLVMKLVTQDEEKADIFKDILKERFAGSNDKKFDSAFKDEVETLLREQRENVTNGSEFPEVTLFELKENIRRLKGRSAPGKDGIYNLMLKNLSEGYLFLLLRLCNLCLAKGKIPESWKKSIITMIPKGSKLATDPNNYRPISLISCVSKLIERILAQRLSQYLEKNGILAPQQSGFRNHRRTTDNLVFQTQKILETMNKKESKVLSLSFDIQAAFDAVWHDGLIFKMHKANVPRYIIDWTSFFLANRSFTVKVNDAVSESAPIVTGVPQGSSVSPILFSIFINDIPMGSAETDSFSLIFADDLTTSFFFEKVTVKNENVTVRVLNYLKKIEEWLCKWRMKMAPEKCSYTVFAANCACTGRHSI